MTSTTKAMLTALVRCRPRRLRTRQPLVRCRPRRPRSRQPLVRCRPRRLRTRQPLVRRQTRAVLVMKAVRPLRTRLPRNSRRRRNRARRNRRLRTRLPRNSRRRRNHQQQALDLSRLPLRPLRLRIRPLITGTTDTMRTTDTTDTMRTMRTTDTMDTMDTTRTTNRPARPVSINWKEVHPIHRRKTLQRGRKTGPRASKRALDSPSKAVRTTRNRAIRTRVASSTTAITRASP
jgi:hypothetical protein